MNKRSFLWSTIILFCLSMFSPESFAASDSRWLTTNTWSSSDGGLVTRVFDVVGKSWQISYANRGNGSLSIRVFNEFGEQSGAIIVAEDQVPGIRTFPGPGRFYLDISDESRRWEVNIRQKVSRLQEWDLRKSVEELESRLNRVASFVGDNGANSFPLMIDTGSWKLVCHNGEGEGVDLKIVDVTTETVLFERKATTVGRFETWVHEFGTFRIDVEARGNSWRLDVYTHGSPLDLAADDAGLMPLAE